MDGLDSAPNDHNLDNRIWLSESSLMISQTAEYALRAVAYLAEHPAAPCTVSDIAAATSMPQEYLAKVLGELTRAGLVRSQRGPTGGFRLATDPALMSVLAVVQAVCPINRIHECPLHRDEHQTEMCPLHKLLDGAIANVQKAFRESSIADLISSGTCGTTAPADLLRISKDHPDADKPPGISQASRSS